MYDNLLPFAFLCLTSFFTLANPLGTMPVFLSMTKDLDNDQRNKILKKATVIALLILIAFTIMGQVIFSLFGISANGFRIAAGFIIFKIGFDMLQAKYSSVRLKPEEAIEYAENITVTPLAIPMLCGPGAIANGIVLMGDSSTWAHRAVLIGSILVIYIFTYLILAASTKLVAFFGKTGNNVMMRLMGLILMVIAVECFVTGAKPILIDIIRMGCTPA